MTEDLSKLDKLPFLEDALQLPKANFSELAAAFMNYSSYCGYTFLPDKISEWCTYLKCDGRVCSYNFNLLNTTGVPISLIPDLKLIPEYCFDLWHCPPPWFAEINYYCIGILCFFLCLLTLIMNAIYLPSFTFYGHRHGTDVLLTTLTFSDIFVIIFLIYLHCFPYLYKDHNSQVLMYSRIVARMVPVFSPLLSLFESLSSWLLCCLLFERYLYQQHGKHAQRIFSTKVSIVITVTFVTVLSFFNMVKLFELETMTSDHGGYTVNLTKTGKGETYHSIITYLIKVPLEYFGPLLGYVVVLGMMYTSFGEQGINSFQSSVEKQNRDIVKNFIIINEADRENRILLSVVVLSTFVAISKFLNFVYHVLSTEDSNVTHEHLNYLKFSCQIVSVVSLLIKPFFYAFITPSYCRDIRRYFVASLPEKDDGQPSSSMTFEQTIANQMRESISYRNSVWASNIKDPETIFNLKDI